MQLLKRKKKLKKLQKFFMLFTGNKFSSNNNYYKFIQAKISQEFP